jgi:PIN domain nuclease of toxin-antitoxin system
MTHAERVLLDTHIWLWLAFGTTGVLRTPVLQAIEHAGQSGGVLVSIVSIWEISLLHAHGRIVLPLPIRDWIALALARPEIKLGGLNRPATVIDSVNLPEDLNNDPADRFLIATARAQRAVLITRDERIIAYAGTGNVNVIAA